MAEVIDLDTIDAQIDALPEISLVPLPPGLERPEYDCIWANYDLVDEDTGELVEARRVHTSWCWGVRGRQLDGDALRWRALRQRWHGAR